MTFQVGDDGELEIIEDYEEKPKRKRKRKPYLQRYLRGCLQFVLLGVFFVLSVVGGFALYFVRNPQSTSSLTNIYPPGSLCSGYIKTISVGGSKVIFQEIGTPHKGLMTVSLDGRAISGLGGARQVDSLSLAADAIHVAEGRLEPVAPYNFIYTWVIDDFGDTQERILTDGVFPTWSPDGKQIVFYRVDGADRYGLYVMDADGSNRVLLKSLGKIESPPSWSPDGKQLVYSTTEFGDDTYNLYILTIATKTEDILLKNGVSAEFPSWSPDGKSIAYVSHDVYTINRDGSNRYNVTDSRFKTVYAVEWSPDSTSLIASGSNVDNKQGIFMMDSDGAGLHSLYLLCS